MVLDSCVVSEHEACVWFWVADPDPEAVGADVGGASAVGDASAGSTVGIVVGAAAGVRVWLWVADPDAEYTISTPVLTTE